MSLISSLRPNFWIQKYILLDAQFIWIRFLLSASKSVKISGSYWTKEKMQISFELNSRRSIGALEIHAVDRMSAIIQRPRSQILVRIGEGLTFLAGAYLSRPWWTPCSAPMHPTGKFIVLVVLNVILMPIEQTDANVYL